MQQNSQQVLFSEIVAKNVFHIPVTYRKIVIWLGIRSQFFLISPISPHMKVKLSKYSNPVNFLIEILICNIFWMPHKWCKSSEKMNREISLTTKKFTSLTSKGSRRNKGPYWELFRYVFSPNAGKCGPD